MTEKTTSEPPDRIPSRIPCGGVDDLYAPTARQTIARLVGDWLHRQHMTATEFIHSADALQKFETAGTTYQHAVQKMAVSMAGRSKVPVVQIIKALNALTTAAMQRVYMDERADRFPSLEAGPLVDFSETLEAGAPGLYVLNGALAKYLAADGTWDAKLLHLIALRDLAAKAEHGELLIRATETLVTELIGDSVVLADLFGADMEFRERLMAVIRLFEGRESEDEATSESLKLLARQFAEGAFSDARAAVGGHILTECDSSRRLCPLSLEDELTAFRDLVEALQSVPDRYLDRDDLAAAFAVRSKRFVTEEALAQLTAGTTTVDEKLDRLLTVAETIHGAANKRSLTPFAVSMLSGRNLEGDFAPKLPGVQRLRRAADLQRRLHRCGFQDGPRDKMAAILDSIAAQIEATGRYFSGIKRNVPDPAERADMYLKLFENHVFTEGNLSLKARRALLDALAEPQFLTRYTADKGKDRQLVLMELIEKLKQVGISPEESMHAMSAR